MHWNGLNVISNWPEARPYKGKRDRMEGRGGERGWIRHPPTPTLARAVRSSNTLPLLPRPPAFHRWSSHPFPSLVLLPPRGKNRRDPLNETDWLHYPDKRSIELRREIQPSRFSCLWKGVDMVVERERRRRTYKCCYYIVEDYRKVEIKFDLIHMYDTGSCAIRV